MLDLVVVSTTQSIDKTVQLLDVYKYVALFPIAVIEGPLITIIAGFVSSLGYLNIFIAYATIVAADTLADCVFYWLGRHGGRPFINKWGHFLKIDQKKALALEKVFHKHGDKTLWLGKTTLVLGIAFLVIAGVVDYPFKRFLTITFLGTAVKTLVLILLGFYFGEAILQIKKDLHYIFVGATIFTLAIIVFYILRKIGQKATEQ